MTARTSKQGMREHLRERENMSNNDTERVVEETECIADHDEIITDYCPHCGQQVQA